MKWRSKPMQKQLLNFTAPIQFCLICLLCCIYFVQDCLHKQIFDLFFLFLFNYFFSEKGSYFQKFKIISKVLRIENKKNIDKLGCDILELYNILENVVLTTSK